MQIGLYNTVSPSFQKRVQIDKKRKNAELKSILIGAGVTGVCKFIPLQAAPFLLKAKHNYNYIQPNKISLFNAIQDNAFTASGLGKKGVKLIRLTKNNAKTIYQLVHTKIGENPFYKLLPKNIKNVKADLIANSKLFMVKYGIKGYFDGENIILNPKRMQLSAFQEFGYAINENKNNFFKVLRNASKLKSLSYLFIIFLLATETKKAEDKNSLCKKDEGINFLRKNAGKLMFAFYIPTLLREYAALKSGEILAEKFLSPAMVKNYFKAGICSFAPHILMAATSIISSILIVKIKDNILNKYDVKHPAIAQQSQTNAYTLQALNLATSKTFSNFKI